MKKWTIYLEKCGQFVGDLFARYELITTYFGKILPWRIFMKIPI